MIEEIIEEEKWKNRFLRERKLRKEAENLLEKKSTELYQLNLQLEKNLIHLRTKNEELEQLNYQLATTEEELRQNYEELKEKEDEIISQNSALKKSNAELDNFVYRVSHDLRAPITSSLGLIQVSKMTDDLKELNYCLNLQESSLLKLDKYIKDILDYSKNSRVTLKIEKIDIKDLIQELFDAISFFGESKIQLTTEVHTSIPMYSDKYRLSVVLANLLSNGVKYARQKQSNSYINFDITVHSKSLEIVYYDNGIGIESEHINEIFSMFFRATDVSTGSGLGLYIAKEAVRKMNGSIKVASESGKWTQFTIQLPNYSESDIVELELEARS